MTWTGTDIFGRRLMAGVGKDGSVIVTRAADDEANEGEEGVVLSFSPASAASITQWTQKQATPPGLRWGVRHKATGKIVAQFNHSLIACGYINHRHAARGGHPHELELVDLAPAPVETPDVRP